MFEKNQKCNAVTSLIKSQISLLGDDIMVIEERRETMR